MSRVPRVADSWSLRAKPWLHTWDFDGDDIESPDGEQVLPRGYDGEPLASGEECALIAAAPDLVRALLKCEWADNDDVDMCPDCWNLQDEAYEWGHGKGCAVDAALTKAGLPDQASRDAARAEMEKR